MINYLCMKIYGIEKLSMVDFDGELCCTLFTAGCNLRCPYCHNSSLVIGKNIFEIKQSEIFEYLNKRKNLLTAICVSGGEPTLNPDLKEYLKWLRQFGLKLKLDSNGSNFKLLKEIIDEKLVDYIAMDVKATPQSYLDNFSANDEILSNIKQSIDYLKLNKVDYEFRCTITSELTDSKIIDQMGQWVQGAKRFFLQTFKDVGTNLEEGYHAVSYEKMQEYAEIMQKYADFVKIRG